eukprot:gb/GECH01011535.1/.p1 GENE.gb/GECH01011535.1/~~gb/GECH01011535.1/.p1  ORF type:complete len:174 (+),score=39.43 gb/GECH01011535.1/:1-522(+)
MKLFIVCGILALLLSILFSGSITYAQQQNNITTSFNTTEDSSSIVEPSDISQILDSIRQRINTEREAALAKLDKKQADIDEKLGEVSGDVIKQEEKVNNITTRVKSARSIEQDLWITYNTSLSNLPKLIQRYNESVHEGLQDEQEQLELIDKVRRLVKHLRQGSSTEVEKIKL